MTYQEILQRIGEVLTKISSGAGDRRNLSIELRALKQKMTKYPEHKAKKEAKKRNNNEQTEC